MASGPSSRRPTNRCTEISCPIRRIVIPRTASSRIRIAPAIARELLVAFGAAADQVTDAPRSLGGLRATPDGQPSVLLGSSSVLGRVHGRKCRRGRSTVGQGSMRKLLAGPEASWSIFIIARWELPKGADARGDPGDRERAGDRRLP